MITFLSTLKYNLMKYFAAFILVFTISIGNAQWTTDTDVNTLVAESEGGDMKAIGASDGKTYVVFWKSVSPPTNYELRMQVLDVDGTQLLGSDGALVSNTIPMSTFTVIWNITIDADNNLYIGATGTGGGDPAYAFKMDSSGNHLWGANGVQVGNGNIVTILPLTSGEAIVSWYPGGESLMQKFSAAGIAVWPSAQPLENAGSDTIPADMFEMAGGGYIMLFHEPLVGINSNLFAQRFDGDGNPVWGNTTQVSNQATAFNRSYGGLQEGDNVYYGYFSSTGVRFDSFLQRIDPDGSLPWGINGSDFDTNQTDYEMDTRIAFESGTQNIWAVCSYTNSSQSDHGEYVQKFNKESGARLLTDTAKEVYPIGSEKVHAGSLQLKEGTPLFLMKSGLDNGVSPTTLHGVYLDDNGDFAWPEETRPVATFAANKSRIHFTRQINGQSVALFIEEKSGFPKIYAQNLSDVILGINDSSNFTVRYTNPVHDELQLQSNSPIQKLIVYNVLGQNVYTHEVHSDSIFTIAMENWTSGLYFVKVIDTYGQLTTLKVLKV
jgi:hypothetical protein